MFGQPPAWTLAHHTFIAALRPDRLEAPILFDGPVNAITFLQYIEQILAPTLSSVDIVISDNLSSYKCSDVREALQEVGADIAYLPPYSPDMNPIEMVFAKIKVYLRGKPSESFEQIIKSLAESLDFFSETICSRLISHAKYSSK